MVVSVVRVSRCSLSQTWEVVVHASGIAVWSIRGAAVSKAAKSIPSPARLRTVCTGCLGVMHLISPCSDAECGGQIIDKLPKVERDEVEVSIALCQRWRNLGGKHAEGARAVDSRAETGPVSLVILEALAGSIGGLEPVQSGAKSAIRLCYLLRAARY
eukprot:2234717-Rhodomonas_salina.1